MSKPTLTIFSHEGFIGAESDLENGEFINDPKGNTELGVVVDSKNVEITSEAKEILKNADHEGGSFASIMLTMHHESIGGGSSIALLGKGKHLFSPKVSLGRTCDKKVLDFLTVNDDIVIPEEFKTACES